VSCQVCSSTLRAGDLFCPACGAVVPGDRPRRPIPEARGRIAGERKYLTVLCADLQRSTDLISELDPEEAISRLEPALIAMRTAVRRNLGIVSKEGGDGLIALFGAGRGRQSCRHGLSRGDRTGQAHQAAGRSGASGPGRHSLGYVVAHVIEADFSS
jgi:class 3 adenylate cyclase